MNTDDTLPRRHPGNPLLRALSELLPKFQNSRMYLSGRYQLLSVGLWLSQSTSTAIYPTIRSEYSYLVMWDYYLYHCYKKWHVWLWQNQCEKSYYASVPYPTICHLEMKYVHFVFEWCILWYGAGTLCDLWVNECEISLLLLYVYVLMISVNKGSKIHSIWSNS